MLTEVRFSAANAKAKKATARHKHLYSILQLQTVRWLVWFCITTVQGASCSTKRSAKEKT